MIQKGSAKNQESIGSEIVQLNNRWTNIEHLLNGGSI